MVWIDDDEQTYNNDVELVDKSNTDIVWLKWFFSILFITQFRYFLVLPNMLLLKLLPYIYKIIKNVDKPDK